MEHPSKTFSLTCNSGTFSFLCPQDSSALLDEISEEAFSEDEFLPYWAEMWPSSETAVEYLPTVLNKAHAVFEIGAGLGVVSTVLAHNGFKVVASDYAEESCSFMRANALHNNVSFEVLCSDWRSPALASLFETIVGVDILYEARWIEAVLLQVSSNLSATGKAYIYDPHRSFRGDFLQAIKEHPTLTLLDTISSPSTSGKGLIDCYILATSSSPSSTQIKESQRTQPLATGVSQ